MKIVFVDEDTITLDDMDFSCLETLGEYAGYPNSNEDEIIERAAGAEYVIANKATMTRKVIGNLPDLRMIAVIATGYNNVDVEAARAHKVNVCNVSGYAATTVPQHTFALILNLATQTHRYHNDIQDGQWNKAATFTLLTYPTFELAGKTIGIIGFGAIGQNVAKIAGGFGMQVLTNTSSGKSNGQYKNVDLDTLLRESDIVTIHCPLTDKTKNLIDADALARMKPSALLINTGRGGIVDEQALVDALDNDRLAGAGFDVLTQEPPKNGSILFDAKNIVLTPHSAWSTVEARQRLVNETARNIETHSQGNPRNVVT
jgi:glycerate dehydrogenase